MTQIKSSRSYCKELVGYAWMSVAILIWASWLVLTSSGRTTDLSVLDLATLRALIPTLILAPLMWRARAEVARIGIVRCLLLSLYGLPFILCVGYGLSMAPVAHAGALVPGTMPLFAAALSGIFMGQLVCKRQLICFSLILLASTTIILRSAGTPSVDGASVGHALFLLGAIFWACFSITAKMLDVSPYLATAIVGSVSSVVVLPLWMFSSLSGISSADMGDIVFQAAFQGILSGLVSVFAFAQAIRILGVKASVVSALVPGIAALMAVPVLGQIPDEIDIIALLLVIFGLGFGSLKRSTAQTVPRSGNPLRSQASRLVQKFQSREMS